MRAQTLRAYALLTLTAICFGANTTFAKIAVGEVSPMVVVCLRWFVVVLLLLLFNWKGMARDWPLIRPQLGYLFFMGALGLATFNGMFYLAAHHTSAINLGIISGMMPVFVLLGGMLAYRATPLFRQWMGVAVTILGVVVVASAGDVQRLLSLQLNQGDVLVVVATVLYAGYTLGLRRRPECSGLSLFTVLAASAFVASLPMVGLEAWAGDFQAPTLQGWGVVVLVALLPSFLAQVMFIRGVEIIGPNRAGIFVNLMPIFAALIAVLYLRETFFAYHGLALVLVLGGIWLAERGQAS